MMSVKVIQKRTNLQHLFLGICEPLSDPSCRAKQPSLSCNGDIGYECPSIDDPGVLSVDLRFPTTDVPSNETNYYCKIFEVVYL